MRAQPIYAPYSTVTELFGVDVSLFLQQSLWFALWYGVLFVLYSPFTLALAVYDWFDRSIALSSNLYTLLVFMARSDLHCYFWVLLQVAGLVTIQFARRARRL